MPVFASDHVGCCMVHIVMYSCIFQYKYFSYGFDSLRRLLRLECSSMTDSCGTSDLEIDTMGQNVAQNSVVCPVVLGWDVLEWDRLQKWKFTVLGSFRPSQSDVCCEVGGGCDPWLHGTLSEVGRTAWTVSYFRPNPAVGRKRTTGKTDSPSHLDGHILALLPCCHPHLELSSFHCLLLQLSWLLQKLCWSLGQPLPIIPPPPPPPPPTCSHATPHPPQTFAQLGLPHCYYYYYEDCFAKLNQLWSVWASVSDLKQQR